MLSEYGSHCPPSSRGGPQLARPVDGYSVVSGAGNLKPIQIGMRDLKITCTYGSANHYLPAVLRTACIKAAVSQTSGLFHQDSAVLDETGALARASSHHNSTALDETRVEP